MSSVYTDRFWFFLNGFESPLVHELHFHSHSMRWKLGREGLCASQGFKTGVSIFLAPENNGVYCWEWMLQGQGYSIVSWLPGASIYSPSIQGVQAEMGMETKAQRSAVTCY